MSLGPAEILVILVVGLLVFGPNRLPEISRQVGRAVREFRRIEQSVRDEVGSAFAEDATAHAEPPPSLPPRVDAEPPSSGPPSPESSSPESPAD